MRGRMVLSAILTTLIVEAAPPIEQGPTHGFDRALGGMWNSATVTPLERPPQFKDKPFFTPEEAAEWERRIAERNEEPPPGAKRTGTGTYNTLYREFGTRTVKTLRTSIVVEPNRFETHSSVVRSLLPKNCSTPALPMKVSHRSR